MNNEIEVGDKVWVQGFLTRHYAVCTGRDSRGEPIFVHNTPAGGVERCSREVFAAGREIHVEQRVPVHRRVEIAARAESLIGKKYNLIFHNCEHVANLAVNGEAQSAQVQWALGLSVLAGAVLVAANNNGTYVDGSGYRRDSAGRFAARRWV